MPMNTLRPIATTNAAQLPPNGAATAHAALSDASDASDCRAQVSTTEPDKRAWHVGPGGLTALPPEADRIIGTVVSVRGRCSDLVAPALVSIFAGDYSTSRVSGNRSSDGSGDGPISTTTSASLTFWTKASQVAASGWVAGVNFVEHDGAQGQVMDIWFDVTWEPTISTFKGLILGALGPLASVGLLELPAIAREVWRRSRTLILPAEYEMAWRALREDRRRVYGR